MVVVVEIQGVEIKFWTFKGRRNTEIEQVQTRGDGATKIKLVNKRGRGSPNSGHFMKCNT